MGVKVNITNIKGKMIGLDGREIYDPRFEKYHQSLMGTVGSTKQAEGGGQEKEEGDKK